MLPNLPLEKRGSVLFTEAMEGKIKNGALAMSHEDGVIV